MLGDEGETAGCEPCEGGAGVRRWYAKDSPLQEPLLAGGSAGSE